MGHEPIDTLGIEKILRKILSDRGKSSGKSFEIKGRIGAEQRILYVKYDWDKIKKRSNYKLILAKVILDKIISLLPENLREGRAEVLSEFYLNDIYDAINNDITLLQQEIDFREIINNTLLYLNDLNISQVENILNSWCAVNHDIEISIEKARNFILEILMEEKREAKTGRGVFLGTVHSVKGMEFKYVFILDKGWQTSKSNLETEEERRLYYVGMTRAEKGLYLYLLVKENNPHIKILTESKFVNLRKFEEHLIPGYFENLKVSVIGMEDIFISWAGTKFERDSVHENLKNVKTGDRVKLVENKDKIYVITSSGNKISALSSKGYGKWKNRIQNIKTARILGIVKRNKLEADVNFNVRVDFWEVPIVEVLHY